MERMIPDQRTEVAVSSWGSKAVTLNRWPQLQQSYTLRARRRRRTRSGPRADERRTTALEQDGQVIKHP